VDGGEDFRNVPIFIGDYYGFDGPHRCSSHQIFT
jgi:hypothetical protein